MRIILSGHTGLEKQKIIANIAAQLPQGYRVRHFSAEGGLNPKTLIPSRDLMDQWWESFDKHVVQPWDGGDEKTLSVITMHACWQVQSHFFSPLISPHREPLIDFLRARYKPDFIITLIDDIYRCQHVIANRDENGEIRGFSFSLAELLRWRNVEIILSDMLAMAVCDRALSELYPYARSPVIAVNHPVRTLLRYCYEPTLPRVYLSYPISAPRKALDSGDPSPVAETNHFRTYFSRELTAFDPVTIDERPLSLLLQKSRRGIAEKLREILKARTEALCRKVSADLGTDEKQTIVTDFTSELDTLITEALEDRYLQLSTADRWPRPGEDPDSLKGEAQIDFKWLSMQQIGGIASEIDKRQSEIDRQIRFRDYRLIDQADCVVIYRPNYGGRADWSGGTSAEARRALFEVKKPLFVITDPSADTPLNEGPFGMDLEGHNRIEVARLSGHGDSEKQRERAFREAIQRVQESTKDVLNRKMRL
jgi:hypothetical protein